MAAQLLTLPGQEGTPSPRAGPDRATVSALPLRGQRSTLTSSTSNALASSSHGLGDTASSDAKAMLPASSKKRGALHAQGVPSLATRASAAIQLASVGTVPSIESDCSRLGPPCHTRAAAEADRSNEAACAAGPYPPLPNKDGRCAVRSAAFGRERTSE